MEKTRHVGEPGARVVVSGVVEIARRIDTKWGNSTGIQIRGNDGVRARWQSSNGDLAHELKPGDVVTVRATVKRYVERDGVLWVILTNGRVKQDALALV